MRFRLGALGAEKNFAPSAPSGVGAWPLNFTVRAHVRTPALDYAPDSQWRHWGSGLPRASESFVEAPPQSPSVHYDAAKSAFCIRSAIPFGSASKRTAAVGIRTVRHRVLADRGCQIRFGGDGEGGSGYSQSRFCPRWPLAPSGWGDAAARRPIQVLGRGLSDVRTLVKAQYPNRGACCPRRVRGCPIAPAPIRRGNLARELPLFNNRRRGPSLPNSQGYET